MKQLSNIVRSADEASVRVREWSDLAPVTSSIKVKFLSREQQDREHRGRGMAMIELRDSLNSETICIIEAPTPLACRDILSKVLSWVYGNGNRVVWE